MIEKIWTISLMKKMSIKNLIEKISIINSVKKRPIKMIEKILTKRNRKKVVERDSLEDK